MDIGTFVSVYVAHVRCIYVLVRVYDILMSAPIVEIFLGIGTASAGMATSVPLALALPAPAAVPTTDTVLIRTHAVVSEAF